MSFVPRLIERLERLKENRSENLLKVFGDIAYRGQKISIQFKSVGGAVIFGISDKHEFGVNYTDWRFRINEDNISALYYERWIVHEKDKYFLENAYFHLYTKSKENPLEEKEYILLHCDASDSGSVYKQSPHLHIKCSTDPMPKAHIALFNGSSDEVLSSLKKFQKAFHDSVMMLNVEVVKRM
jgi:hypothetical protein